jgi:hypothetical protein
LESVCVLVVILASGDRACWRRGWRRAALARNIISLLGATGIAVEYGRAQVAFVPPCSSAVVILSEHAEALKAGHRIAALRRVRVAAQSAVFDWHRQALRAQRNVKRVHALGPRLGRLHIEIAARAVMDNDIHARVQPPIGSVVDATERHGVSAASLDVPELNAAAVRIGVDAVGTASHTQYVAVTQVVRGIDTQCHTHCDRRDNGGPYTFADI